MTDVELLLHMTNTGSINEVNMQDGSQALQFGIDLLLDEVYAHPGLPEALKQSLSGAVTWQQRNETSLARFLAGPNQFPAFTLALLVSGASVRMADGQSVDLNGYLVGKDRQAAALQVSVAVPGRKIAAARVGLTPTGEGIVLAAGAVTIEKGVVKSARLALSGVWSKKQWLSAEVEKLAGAPLHDDAIQAVAAAVQIEVNPPTDHLGSAAYRRAMAGVLTRQVLEACR
jgi:xanthine dehydrogenase small subunit